MDIENNRITQGPILPALLRFYFPIVLGTFFQVLYSTVDAIIVGQFVGKEALGAVGGSTSNILSLFIYFFMGLGTGASVVISQQYGAKNRDGIFRSVHTGVALSLSAGLAMTAFGLLASPWMITVTGVSDALYPYCLTYLRISFLGSIANLMYNLGTGILRAVGDSKRPLYYLVASCLINIVLDLVFVAGLHMDVAGAAWATVLSQCISAVLVLRALIRTEDTYKLYLTKLKIYPAELRQILRIGLPAGLQSTMYNFSNVLIQSFINAFDTNTLAAYSAFCRIDAFFWMVLGAMGTSVCTFIGQNYGAQKLDRVKRSIRLGMGLGFGLSAITSTAMHFLGLPLLRMFTSDAEVLQVGVEIVRFLTPYYFTFVAIEILAAALRGMGSTLMPTIITCSGVCVLRIIWLMVTGRVIPGSFKALLTCYPVSWVLTSALFVWYYVHFMKRDRLQAGN